MFITDISKSLKLKHCCILSVLYCMSRYGATWENGAFHHGSIPLGFLLSSV